VTKDIAVELESALSQEKEKERLTPRQRQVLQLIAEGRTMKEIGQILATSTRTVECHKYGMMESLGIQSTAELFRYAITLGLVQVRPRL